MFLFALAGKVLLPYIYKRGDSGQNNSNQIPKDVHQAKSRSRNQNQQIDTQQQIDQSGSQNLQNQRQNPQRRNQSRNQDPQSENQQTNQNFKQQPNNLALKIFKGSSTVVMIFLILIYANTHVNPFGPRPEDMGIY